MNKEAVNDSFLLFQDTGYNGTIEDFTKLISTNDEALADAYGLFTNTGYNGTQDDFNELVGVKKKDATEVSELVSEGGPEGTTSVSEEVATTTPSGSLAGEETDITEESKSTTPSGSSIEEEKLYWDPEAFRCVPWRMGLEVICDEKDKPNPTQSLLERHPISRTIDGDQFKTDEQEVSKEEVVSQKHDCDPATQTWDASSNKCVDWGFILKDLLDEDLFTVEQLIGKTPPKELQRNPKNQPIFFVEGQLDKPGTWWVITNEGVKEGVRAVGGVLATDDPNLYYEGSIPYAGYVKEKDKDPAIRDSELLRIQQKDEKVNRVNDLFSFYSKEDIYLNEQDKKKEEEIKKQEAVDYLSQNGFKSQVDGDLFRKYINENPELKKAVDDHLSSIGLKGGLTANLNDSYNNKYIKEAIKFIGGDYLDYINSSQISRSVNEFFDDNIEYYKNTPIVSNILSNIKNNPILIGITQAADFVENKSKEVKNYVEPRLESLTKGYDEFEDVYKKISTYYGNDPEFDINNISGIKGATTMTSADKMIYEFNDEFVDKNTGIVIIPYDKLNDISQKIGVSPEDLLKFSKQYEVIYQNNISKDINNQYDNFQLHSYVQSLKNWDIIPSDIEGIRDTKWYETKLGQYYFNNINDNPLEKFPFDDEEVVNEFFGLETEGGYLKSDKFRSGDEDDLSEFLNSTFGVYGVNFYATQKGSDVVKAVARNGEEFDFHFNISKERRPQHQKDLVNFLKKNSTKRSVLNIEQISQLKSGFSIKGVDQEWVKVNASLINKGAESLKQDVDDLSKEIKDFESAASDMQLSYMKDIASLLDIEGSTIPDYLELYSEGDKSKTPEAFMKLLTEGIDAKIKNGEITSEEELNVLKKDIEQGLEKMNTDIVSYQEGFKSYIHEQQVSLQQKAVDYQIQVKDFEIATYDHYNMESQMGTFLGATWDSLLQGVGSLQAGGYSVGVDIGILTGFLTDKEAKEYKERNLPRLREGFRKAIGTGTYDAYIQEMEKTFLGGSWLGLMKSIPAMSVSLLTGGGAAGVVAFSLQQVDFLDQEFEKNPQLKDLPELEKWAVKGPVAVVSGILENYGFTQAVKGGNSLATRLVVDVLNKTPKGATPSMFNKLITGEIDNLIAKGVITIGKGGVTEFETGFLQSLNEVAVKDIYDFYKDGGYNDIFETSLDEGALNYVLDAGYAGAQEMIGGFVMSAPRAISKGISDNNFGKASTDLQFQFMEAIVKDPMSKDLYLNMYKSEIANKNLTKSQAEKLQNDFNTAESIVNQINENADIQDRKKSFDLLSEKRKLEQEVAGKDKSTVEDKYNRINEINEELADISKYAEANKIDVGTPLLNEAIVNDVLSEDNIELLEDASVILANSPSSNKNTPSVPGKVITTTLEDVNKAKENIDKVISNLENTGDLKNIEIAEELRKLSESVSNVPVAHSVHVNQKFDTDVVDKIQQQLQEQNEFKNQTTYIIDNKIVSAREFDNKINDVEFKKKLQNGEASYSVINATENKINELENMPMPVVSRPIAKISETQTTEETTSIEERVGLGETITERNQEWDVTEKDNLPEAGKTTEEFTEELKTGTWGMLTAENPNAQQETDQFNEAANEKAKKWLEEKGYKPVSIFGKYENSEKSFYVPGLTSADAIAFAKEFNQESVATDQGLIYQDGTMNPINKGQEEIGVEKDNYYSTIKTSEGNVDFAVSYDFDTTTEVEMDTETTTETEADAPQRKADKIIEGLEKLKKDLDQPGTLQVNLFPGQDKAVKAAIDITIGAIKAGDVVVQAIEKGYKKLKELGFEGSLEDYQNYLVQNPDVEITEADITVEEEVIDLKEATLEEQIKDLEGRDDAAARRKRKKLQEELDDYRAQKETEAEATVEEEVTEEAAVKPEVAEDPLTKPKRLTQEEVDARQKEEGIIVPNEKGGIANKLWNNIKSWKKKKFSARKRLPKSVFKFKEQKDAAAAKALNTVRNTAADFNKAYKNYKGDKDQLINDVNAYLEGNTDVVLPDEVKGIVVSMRNQIDFLSNELINTGQLTPEQADVIKSNLGSYLNRDYEVFTNKNWKKKVSDEVVNKAKNFLKNQYKTPDTELSIKELVESDPDKYIREGETVDEAVDREINRRINKLLNRDGAAASFFEGMQDKRNLSIYKERSDIPVELRALMGEFTDPIQRYAQTVSKLISEVSTVKYFQNIKEAGMGVYFFEEGQAPDGFDVKIAPDATKSYDPLGGLYTTPEIAQDLKTKTENIHWIVQGIFKLQSGVKWSKTIGSVGTHSKNILGNVGFMMMNGHNPLDVKTMSEAYTMVRSNMFPKSDKTRFYKGKMSEQDKQAMRDRYNRYVELGIINQSAGLGEIRAMFKDANFDIAMKERLQQKPAGLFGKAKAGAIKLKEGAEAAYQAEDDFFKIIAFETELNRYSQAMFGKNKSDLSEQEVAEVESHVAEIVKNTYPNYARVPEAIQKLRRNPLVGNFVSFQAEVYRTTYNSVALAFKEIKSDNPAIKKIGYTRLASMTTYMGAKNTLMGMFGMSAGTGLFGDDDDEGQKNKDVRRFVPFFSENSDLIPLDSMPGIFEYIDISSSDPHGSLNKIVNAFMSGENTVEAFGKALAEALTPFTGVDITASTIDDVLHNEDTYGRDIYNEQDPDLSSQIADISNYILKKVELGTVSSIRKVTGSDQPLQEFIGQMTGFKPWKIDIAEQMSFKGRNAVGEIKGAKKIYNKELYRFNQGEATQADKDEAYDKTVRSLTAIYETLIEDYNAAIRLGTDKDKIIKSLEDSGLSTDEIADIIHGKVPEYIPYDVAQRLKEEKRQSMIEAEAGVKDVDPIIIEEEEAAKKPDIDALVKEFKHHKEKHKRLSESEIRDIVLKAEKTDTDIEVILQRKFAIKKIMLDQNIGPEEATMKFEQGLE